MESHWANETGEQPIFRPTVPLSLSVRLPALLTGWVRPDPLRALAATCSAQPLPSSARRDLLALVAQLRPAALAAEAWALRLRLGASAARFGALAAEPRGHGGWRVRYVAWRGCGERLATAGADGSVVVWDAAAGARVRALAGHGAAGVECVAWSPDRRRLATASHDGTARVWDADTGAAAAAAWVAAVAWAPDGLRVFSGSEDRTARV